MLEKDFALYTVKSRKVTVDRIGCSTILAIITNDETQFVDPSNSTVIVRKPKSWIISS
jgi:hypothetical protein